MTPTLAVTVRSSPSDENLFPIARTALLAIMRTSSSAAESAQQDELVPSEAGDGVAPPANPSEAAAYLDEDSVACLVAKRVVDRLEVVEVDEKQGYPAVGPVEGDQGLR